MSNRNVVTLAAMAVVLSAIGCMQYNVDVSVNPDGSGQRTVVIELDGAPADSVAQLLPLGDGGWIASVEQDQDGKARHLYRRESKLRGLDDWSAAGGLLVRGEAGGRVRLVSEVSVEQVRTTAGVQHVYRETLRWEHLRLEVAAHAANVFAAWLGDLQPALPPAVVDEMRGVVAAAVAMGWQDVGAEDSDAEDRIEREILTLVEDRLGRAGVPAARAAEIRTQAEDCDLMTGIEKRLPGLGLALESGFELRVTMPGRISGGNADLVEGNVAVWKVDLARVTGRPLTLVAESGR